MPEAREVAQKLPFVHGWHNSTKALSVRFRVFVEPVHPQRPLKSDNCALDRLQRRERGDQGERKEYRKLLPYRRGILSLNLQRGWHHDVSDNNDDEVGRKIVGTMRREVETAY
jgi:hypothetical protein